MAQEPTSTERQRRPWGGSNNDGVYGTYSSAATLAASHSSVKQEDYTAVSSGEEMAPTQKKERFDPFSRYLTFAIFPTPLPGDATPQQTSEWLPMALIATPWLSLFFDLVAVAALSVAASSNDLSYGYSVADFFSLYILIYVMWLTSVLYDSRYQANDIVHRLAKLIQLVTFAYLGASSAGWSPSKIVIPPGRTDSAAVESLSASESFKGIVWSYFAGKVFMSVQYAYIYALARWANRPRRSFLLSLAGQLAAAIFSLAAGALPANTKTEGATKTTLLYVGVASEVIAEASALLAASVQPELALMIDRLGSMTLVMLGEGFTRVLDTFAKAVKGFGRSDAWLYAQVVCCIFIFYMLWHFLFAGLSDKQHVGRHRLATWILLHFPLQLSIFLMIVGIANVLRYTAYDSGMNWAIGEINVIVSSAVEGVFPPPNVDMVQLSLQMNKLNLYPDWDTALTIFDSSINDASDPNDPVLLLYQYMSQIGIFAAVDYGLAVQDSQFKQYEEIGRTDLVFLADSDARLSARTQMLQAFVDLASGLANDGLVGTVWVLPTAGGALFLGAVLHLVRVEHPGRQWRIFEYLHAAVGLCMCLLGLLSIGKKEYRFVVNSTGTGLNNTDKTAPILHLVEHQLCLPLITVIFAVLYFVDTGLLFWARRREVNQQANIGKAEGVPSLVY